MTSLRRGHRHARILEVLGTVRIGSQEELLEALAAAGVTTTQATLSRDLRELQVLRVPTEGGYRYLPAAEATKAANAAKHATTTSLPGEVLSVEANEASVVIRTAVARAQGVALALDRSGDPDLLATLAGDDTVLCIPRSVRRTRALQRRLEERFQLSPTRSLHKKR